MELFEFKFYKSYTDTFDNLTDEEAWKLLKRMYKFYFNNVDKKSDSRIVEMIFPQIKYTLEKSLKWKQTWWHRNTTPSTVPSTTPSTKDKDKDKDNINNNNISNTKDIKSLVLDNFNYKISKYFLDYHIKEQTPSVIYLLKSKWEDNILISWSKVIEKLQTIDKFTEEQIEFIIKKTLEDDFWKYQILSIEKYRKKKDWVSYFVKMIDIAKQNMKNTLVINENIWTL